MVLVHYSAPPVVGGVERVLGQHARMMADAGHAVRIIAGRGATTDKRIAFTSVPVVDSQTPDILRIKSELDAGRVPDVFEKYAAEIAAQVRDLAAGADWLIAHNVCSLNKNLPLTAALHQISQSESRPRMMLWHHDLAWTSPRYRDELHYGYPWDLLRTDWPGVTQVAVSEHRSRELTQLWGEAENHVRVVPNGLDAPQFLGLGALTRSWVEDLQLLKAAPLILLPARITPRKNIEMALRVLSALRQEFPEARLLVTGPLGPHDATNSAYMRRLMVLRKELGLETSAHILAELTDDALPDEVISELYRLADALLLPSRDEGFGIPILEAGLTGLPVFCADIPALRELGAAQVEYFSVDQSPAQVAVVIANALNTSPRYSLRRRVLREFTWERIYSNHLGPLLESA